MSEKIGTGDASRPNASEALYGFVAWLTSRPSTTIMSAKHDCSEPARLVEAFCKANNLDEVRECFPDCFVMPGEKRGES